MPGFHRRPLALLICCLSADIQSANVWADEPAAGGEGALFGLKVERKMLSTMPKGIRIPKQTPLPTFINAERIAGKSDEESVAEGNVEVRKLDSQLFADRVVYRPLDDEVDALGNVRLYQFDDEMRGTHLHMKMAEQVGYFEAVDYKVRREVINRYYRPVTALSTIGSTSTVTNAPMMLSIPTSYGLTENVPTRRPTEAYGHSKRIDFQGENQLRLTDGTYSTCKPGRQDWYLRSDEIHLDYDKEEGKSSHAVVYFQNTPIFYTPYASFSLNHNRQSGFLPVMFSASTKNGLDFTLPYYWNLAPNYDATFYPREISKRGLQLGSEVRYLDHNYNGMTRFEYLPGDKLANRDRWAYNLAHNHNFGQGLGASINWNGVSDDLYWSDLSSRLLQTTQTQLPRQLTLSYTPPNSWWSSSATWLRFQTLQPDPANRVARPYFLEPQINFSGRLPDLYQTDFSVVGQYSQFRHPTQVEGARMLIYPQLSLPIVYPSFTLTPKLGLHATQYQLDRQANGVPSSISRVIPTFTLDSTVTFEREMKWLGFDHIQTLEPRLYYVNIPNHNQNAIPVFDSGLSDFNFAQIFTENRYTGYDRINDANQLTAAVTTRLLDSTTGAERFKVMLGQRYYLSNQHVLLPGEATPPKRFSNTLAAFNGLVFPKTYVDSALEYNNHEGRTDRFSIGARYQPDTSKVLSASYRFVRNGIGSAITQVDQIDVAGQWQLSGRWHAVGRYNYSIRDKQLLETVGGVEYNGGCWAARFVVQRLEAVAGTPNTTFFFQLELNDFASIGSNPVQLLRRSIPGYGKINELPSSGSLLTSE